MNVFTVSFFGHRQIDDPFAVEERLEPILREFMEYAVRHGARLINLYG